MGFFGRMLAFRFHVQPQPSVADTGTPTGAFRSRVTFRSQVSSLRHLAHTICALLIDFFIQIDDASESETRKNQLINLRKTLTKLKRMNEESHQFNGNEDIDSNADEIENDIGVQSLAIF